MATTTPVSQLIINKLTKAQYESLEYKDPYQLYMITDGTATTLTLGTWVSTTRADIPYGLLRADGKCYSSELSSSDVSIYYTKDSFPGLWAALENGTIRSVGTYTFERALEANGWCGVFGFGKEEVTRKFYSWGGLYWLLSETPKTGDRAYDANGKETDRTVTVADDGSVTFVQDVSGGTVSGLVRDSANDYSITQVLGRDDVFYMPKVTNHEQQNVAPEINGSNKNLGRILVAEQIPTVENLYTWYKLYSDGWVEQGGYISAQTNAATVTLPVQMANAYYTVLMAESDNIDASTDVDGCDMATCASNYTTTTFRVSKPASRETNWTLQGYANITKISGFRAPEDNFLIQAYNTNKEVKVADYNDQVQQYVDNSVIPEIDKTAGDWLKDITYKMGMLVQSNKTETPAGLIKLDGKNTDGIATYSKESYPDFYNAIKDGTIKSIPESYFLQLIEENGWCGVCGLQEAADAYDINFYCWTDGANILYTLESDPGTEKGYYSAPNPDSLTNYTRGVLQIDGFSINELEYAIFTRDRAGDTIYTVPAKHDCFYAPKITNVHQYGVQPGGDGINKHLGRVLVKSQEPTAENNYTWYNLYDDGWVEQGGKITDNPNVVFPIAFASANDAFITTGMSSLSGTNTYNYNTNKLWGVTSSVTAEGCSLATASGQHWHASGYSAQINSLPTYYMVGYSDMEEPTIGDYSAMLDEYVNRTLEPNLTSYTDNEIERLNRQSADWSKDITYKMGNLVQSTRSDLPLGLIRADGLNTDGETTYTPENYPDLYEAIVDGKIKSVDIVTFNNLIEANGWCGVFGLQTKIDGSTTNYYAWQLPDGNVTPPDCERTYYTTSEQPSPGDVAYAYISGAMVDTGYNTIQEITTLTDGTQQAYITYTDGWGYNRNTSYDITIGIESRPACFYAPKITNIHQYGATPTTDGANKHLGRTLIKSQEPTAENNYTWYNLYNDGWVEQGGIVTASATTTPVTVTLPVEMSDTYYGLIAKVNSGGTAFSNMTLIDCKVIAKTTTTFGISSGYAPSTGNAYSCSWSVCGYAFEAPKQLPTCFIVAYSDATEVTIGDYNAMLQEYKEETIKPDIYNYSESLKPGLQEYVDKAQEWATSDSIVDAENDLYSAKKYAERAADVVQCYYQPIRYVDLTANDITTVKLDTHPIVICQASGGDLDGGSTYTINLSLDVTTTEIDCWTYEVHLQVGDAIPTINWQTSDSKQIRWMAYSPKTPQLTNANAMFVFRNQGGILIGNYSGAY